jgi:hypothetical protein
MGSETLLGAKAQDETRRVDTIGWLKVAGGGLEVCGRSQVRQVEFC